MTVAFTSPTTGIVRSLGDQSVKLSAVLNNRAPAAKEASADTQSVKVAAPDAVPQFPPVSLRVEAVNVASVASRVQSFDAGATEVSNIIGQLQSIALRANDAGLSEAEREILKAQFHALARAAGTVPPPPAKEIPVDEAAAALGSAAPDLGKDAPKVLGFNSQKLFGDADIDTVEAASEAVETLKTAAAVVEGQRNVAAKLVDAADFASASIDTAIENQAALASTLTEDDIAGKAGASLVDTLRAQSDNARLAQTSRLPDDVLKLIS